jgi:sterol 24-C-methyltransferase
MSSRNFQGAIPEQTVKSTVESYSNLFTTEDPHLRKLKASELSRDYYDLATDFYEYGWGQSFHFAPRQAGETVKESLIRYEHNLALKLKLSAEQSVLDVGCGVGGPMRNIARFSGATITGLTINQYQIDRGTKHNHNARLEKQCGFKLGDFLQMPFEAETFDAAYTIEAACHAADRRGPFKETYRVLKKGALFAGYEWCTTDLFDANNAEHRRIKLGIEKGNGLPDVVSTHEVEQSLKDSGFELLEATDWALTAHQETPWYQPLQSGVSLTGFRNSRAGAFVTHQVVRVLETMRLSPKGTVAAHDLLRTAQASLVEGGETGIFTPMFFFLARKK